MVDVCAYGYITKESEIFRGVLRRFIAGPPYFFSIALKSLGSSVRVITKVAPEDEYILNELKELGIEVINLGSKSTSSFHTVYGKTLDERYIKVLSVAEPFSVDDLKHCSSCRYVYVGPLTTKDFNVEFLERARKVAPVILDVQGFTREVSCGSIRYVDWSWKIDGCRFIDVFKADTKEAKLLTGIEDPVRAIDIIMDWGPKEVLITSSKGVYLGVKGVGKFFAPFIVDEVIGRVGRGDTCTAAYVHARLRGFSYEDSIVFAAAATSLKLMVQGPLKSNEADVLKYKEVKYRGISVKL